MLAFLLLLPRSFIVGIFHAFKPFFGHEIQDFSLGKYNKE